VLPLLVTVNIPQHELRYMVMIPVSNTCIALYDPLCAGVPFGNTHWRSANVVQKLYASR